MNGSGSGGNPSAALSHSHPARPDQQTPRPAGQMSQSEGEDQQSSQVVHLSQFYIHLGSAENHQKDQQPLGEDQSPTKDDIPLGKHQNDQSPAEKDQRPTGEDKTPAKKDQRQFRKKHKQLKKEQNPQCSADKDQISVSKHYSPSEKDQTPGNKEQRPVEKKLIPARKNLSPVKKNQRTTEKDKKDHSSPEKDQIDHSPSKKGQSPSEKDHSPSEKDHSPPEKDHSSPEKDHSPPEKDHTPPEKDHSPPEKDHSPPEKDHSPPEKDHSPPEKDHSPPEKDHTPPEKDHSPPEKDHSLPAKDHSPKKDHSPSDKDHNLPEKDHSPPEKDHSPKKGHSPSEKDHSPPEKDHNPQKDHSPPERDHSLPAKDHSPKKDHSPSDKDHNLPEKDHSPPEKDHSPKKGHSPSEKDHSPKKGHSPSEKDHSPSKKSHSSAEKGEKDQRPAEKDQKNQRPKTKDQSPSEKDHSSVEKDHPPVEKHQRPSIKDQNPAERKLSSSEKHHRLQTLQEKDQEHQSSAETQPMKKELDEQSIFEHRNDNPLTEDSTSSKDDLHQPGPEDPRPDIQDTTQLVACPAQQQQLEGSPLIETPPPKEPPDPLKPDPLSTDHKCEACPQSKQEAGQQPRQDLGPDPKPEPEQKLDQAPNEERVHQAEDQTEPSQDQSKTKSPFVDQSVEKSPVLDVDSDQTPSAEAQQDLLAAPANKSNLTPALALNIEPSSNQVQPLPAVSSPSEPKLCGFLQKQGGPLRAWKQRWFTYEEQKNQMFYYRTPQDVRPLGRVDLSGATFTYPLKAEKGTFHIKTPERTFILRATSQELMLYWLQQLQIKRWHHRQNQSCRGLTNNNNNNTADDFLPVLKSPIGLVGEEAAITPTQRTPLSNVSIKHPFIEIQNSVHSMRKRSSQEFSQSVFYVEAPLRVEAGTAEPASPAVPSLPRPLSEPETPPPIPPLADPAGQSSPLEGRESPSLFDSYIRKMKTPSTPTMSLRRKDSDRTSRLLQENQMLMEEVKAQKELVWILHKALEASQLEKRTCAEFLSVDGEQERLELLRHRERQAADLRGKLEEAEATVEAARKSAVSREVQVSELQENIRMLTEKNNAKQEVIIKLSDQVTSYMSKPQWSDSHSGRYTQEALSLKQLQQEVENLKDDIEAYKIQNKFLNSEIYQLTQLWRTSSQQEKSLMVKCAHLEATNCQVESRYLGVLRQLQETKSLDPVQREAVQKMIEDALKGKLTSVLKLNTNRVYDEYGFKIIPDYEVEDMKLLAKIQALEIRSHNLLHQEAVERPLLSRWAQYLAGRSDQDLCPSPEFKVLVRGGIPPEYRPRVWCWIVQARTRTIQDHHPQHYQQLCEKSRTSPHPASRQIQLDLHRTLTTNQHFSPSSPALQQLRRILLAFSWHNPAIGYCQGLNRLAAVALLVLQNEEDAFWCLVAVVESIMPLDYYTKNLVASQADQRVLKDFMMEKLPRLAAHLEEKNIDVSLVTFNWFLVVFVESLPSDILLPLWDAFLYEGTKVMFRYALALFKYKEEDILKISDSVEIYQYLRFFTKTISDSRKLTNIAFSDMNPFPRRLLRNRRAFHLDRLQGELHELEEQQKSFLTESAEHKDKDVDMAASEDDDDI